jgi:AcrR family transcriptional regulator
MNALRHNGSPSSARTPRQGASHHATMQTPSKKPRSKNSVAVLTPASPEAAAPGRVYSSALMHDRRQRILEETRRAIEEGGIENLSVRELCKRADIAQRTLYNAFGSKDRVVGIAIRDHYLAQIGRMKFSTPDDSIDGVIERMARVSLRATRQKNYLKAILEVYFSSLPHPDIVDVTRDIARGNVMPWLLRLRSLGQMNPHLAIDEVADDMAELVLLIMRRWTVGQISGSAMQDQVIRGFLTLAIGAAIGKAQANASSLLEQHARASGA